THAVLVERQGRDPEAAPFLHLQLIQVLVEDGPRRAVVEADDATGKWAARFILEARAVDRIDHHARPGGGRAGDSRERIDIDEVCTADTLDVAPRAEKRLRGITHAEVLALDRDLTATRKRQGAGHPATEVDADRAVVADVRRRNISAVEGLAEVELEKRAAPVASAVREISRRVIPLHAAAVVVGEAGDDHLLALRIERIAAA